MIETREISFDVPGKTILNDLNFSLKKGSFNGIIGKNGAGKSTLIQILAGLKEPTKGEVLYQELPLGKISDLAQKRAVLSQEIPVSFGLSVFDILLMGRFPHRPLSSNDFEYVDQIIEELQLQDLLETPYPHLSGGERQRVQFGRTLCQLMPFDDLSGKTLILDEPLSAFDLSIQQMVLKFIKRLQTEKNLTVVLILHDLNWISNCCDHVLLLEKGELQLEGTPEMVFTVENLKKYFGIETRIILNDKEKPNIIYL